MADVIAEIIDAWNIKGKVFAVVTDNAASAVKCIVKLMKNGYCTKHVRCSTHTLQLCVNYFISANQVVIDIQKRVKEAVALFHQSVVLTEGLKAAQTQANTPQHKLVQAVPMRWNSVFYMFHSADD